MYIKLDFPDAEQLARALSAVDRKVDIKMLRDAGIKAMEPVLEDMVQHAGFDESSPGPHMRDSIKISSTTKGKSLVRIRVGPSKKHYMKSLAQEFGTIKQVANPYIRPALDYNKAKVLRILATEIRYSIENR